VKIDKDSEEHNHDHDSHDFEDHPNKAYKLIFTIVFIPLCLFIISNYIANQVHIRGQSYIGFNMFDDAIRQYKKAVLIDKREPDYWYWLAFCYRTTCDYDNAINAYKKASEIDPYNHLVIQDIGMTYVLKEDYRGALVYFNNLPELIEKNDSLKPKDKVKSHEVAVRLIATCYEKLGEFKNAKTILIDFLKKYPTNTNVREKLSLIEKLSAKK